ncbi:MAG TPA: ATP-binding cassette domain-containing protein [Acidimicrobiales bacterium]|nr:ATP-binding cassette domain-containing protein [Acidimicrobiales bacterium]
MNDIASADLVVTDLTVEYTAGDYVVRPLDKLNLHASDGSLVILLGPSGCGKTTLLSALAGILTPTSGTITHAGRTISGLTGKALTEHRRHGVGVVFQAFNLVPSLDATENVMSPMLAAGISSKDARARALGLLDQVGLSERAHHHPGDMSGGQQQRVAIARALGLDPPLILADEPTAHLDYIQVETVLRIVRGLAAPGRVVVVATHDDRMIPLADQVVELVPRFVSEALAPQQVELAAGDVVFEQGDRGDRIYIIDSGSIEVVRLRGDGTEEQLAVLNAGDYFGEMGPLFGLPRSATTRAIEPSTITGYSVKDFRDKLGIERLGDIVTVAKQRV